jgi:hypothetical protein
MKRKTHMLALVSGLMAAAVMFIGCTVDAPDNSPPTTEPDLVVDKAAKDLAVKFGVTSDGKMRVTDTLEKLHTYLAATPAATGIALGDYIELPSLTVEALAVGETIATSSTLTNVQVLVVGVNSFNGKNENNIPHVVFQFKDALVKRTMRVTAHPYKYIGSGMQTYLTGNFVTALASAGVSSNLWAPRRAIAEQYGSGSATIISDIVWLPTEREIFGDRTNSVDAAETAINQARLEYYTTDALRQKVLSPPATSSFVKYWLASPVDDDSNAPFTCAVSDVGGVGCGDAIAISAHPGEALGFAPAFCVK